MTRSVIQSHATQKLCVRFQSVVAMIRRGDHGGDHLLLPSRQRQRWRKQRRERPECMSQRLRDQRMGARTAIEGLPVTPQLLASLRQSNRQRGGIGSAHGPDSPPGADEGEHLAAVG